MRVLVLGGTGAIGTHFVRSAMESGMEVSVTSRTRSGSEGSIRYVRGDAHNDGFLRDLTRDRWGAIVDFMAYGTAEFHHKAQFFLNTTDQYVFLSSARVFASSNSPITEDSPRLLESSSDKVFLNTDEYSLAKARQEDILKASKTRNWTIVRPYITYSGERLQLGVLEKEAWLYRALRGRSILFCREMVPCLTTMTDGKDVGRAISALIGAHGALGESFNVVISESMSWDEIIKIYLDCFRRRHGLEPEVKLVGLNEFMRAHPWRHQILYDRIFNRRFNNNKIARFINTETFTGMGEGLRTACEEFLTKPVFKELDWKTEAIKDKLAQECALVREPLGLRNKVRYLVYRYL